MIVVKLMGGMGNQMFQYAFGRKLAHENKVPLYLDLQFLLDRTPRENFVFRDYDLDIFNLDVPILTTEEREVFFRPPSFLERLLGRNASVSKVQEEGPTFDHKYLLKGTKIYAEGYWQSERYFEGITDELNRSFTFKNPLNDLQQQLHSDITETNSVCMNFRRTDYVNLKGSSETHGVTGMSYYSKAVEFLKKHVGDFHLFVFSDDIEWCRENVDFKLPTTFVGHEYKGVKFAAYLQLMSSCKHFIIPNSSFAWWAAWLSKQENKVVIAPQKWFENADLQNQSQDIIPESWIKM